MRIRNVFALAALSLVSQNAFAEKTWLSPDFFVNSEAGFSGFAFEGTEATTTGCRAHIAKVICVMHREGTAENCIPGGTEYAHSIEELFDRMPPKFQQMFCSIKHIQLEPDHGGTAYAGTNDKNEPVMGIRTSLLEHPMSLAQWASWKEQLSFGGATGGYTVSPLLPEVREVSQEAQPNDLLYFVISHEFGHLFDFANGVNQFKNCANPIGDKAPDCDAVPGTWSSLSWQTNHKSSADLNFSWNTAFCFYDCKTSFLSKEFAAKIYSDLEASHFVSTYASTNPYDDWAETIAYENLSTYRHAIYLVDTKQGFSYDATKKLSSNQFKSKHQYFENFFSNVQIKYP